MLEWLRYFTAVAVVFSWVFGTALLVQSRSSLKVAVGILVFFGGLATELYLLVHFVMC